MADNVVQSLEVALFAQPGGPNTQTRFLGCHTIGSATRPRGNNTLNYCPDPIHPRRYVVSSKTKAPPGLVTFTVETKMRRLMDYLEELNCPIPLIANVTSCSPKNQFSNWDRSFIFQNADVVQETLNNLVSGGADNNEVMQAFDMEADDIIRVVPLRVTRDSSIAETVALNHLFACDTDICAGPCGAANEKCDTFYAVGDAIAGSVSGRANLWINRQGVWTVAAADPFGTGEHIIAGACFQLSRNTRRILVFRGSTDVGAPAEAAYSDDNGATWTNVNIGSDNGEFISSPHALAVIDQNNIWVGTDSGRIYFSGTGGASWSVQEDQGIHAGVWNWVAAMDDRTLFAGGAADVIAVSIDGGEVWSQVNATGGGGDITAGGIVDTNNFWVGTDDGEFFYTSDAGVEWGQRDFLGAGVGRVDDVMFVNNMVGFMSHRNGSAKSTFYQTRNGGFSWESIDTATNSGVNSILACGNNKVWAVGEASGGRPVVYKLQPSA